MMIDEAFLEFLNSEIERIEKEELRMRKQGSEIEEEDQELKSLGSWYHVQVLGFWNLREMTTE